MVSELGTVDAIKMTKTSLKTDVFLIKHLLLGKSFP